jgi:hypothetical protein
MGDAGSPSGLRTLLPEPVLKYGVEIAGIEGRPGKNRQMMGTTLARLAAQLES